MAQSYSVQAVLSAVDNGFTSTFNTATNTAMSMGEKVSSSLKTIGNVTSIVGAATTAMGVAGLKSFGQFQKSLNTAAVVAGGTSKDIKGLSDVANKMGADLPISAQQAADAMTEMARNGASVGQIKEQFPAIAQAATAAGSDLTTTAGVVQQAMNIWGNSLKSPQQAAEILVQTANMSNASIEDMQQAMATFSGTAKLANISMQDSTEAIGLITNKGFSAAQASQDLNHAVLQMLAPSKQAKGVMDELGISFTDAQGKMKSFPQILQDLNKSMDGLTDAEKTKKLKAMFGTSGMEAIAPLMDAMKNHTNDSTKSWDAWAKAVDKAAGTGKASEKSLKDQANEMQKNIGAKVEQVGGNWEALRNTSLASHNAMSGAMLDLINKTLSWANTSHSGFAKFIQGAIGLAPVLGPVVTVTGQFLAHAERLGRVAIAAGKGIWNLVAKFTPLPKILPKASAGMDKNANSTKKGGKSADESATNFLRLGTAVLEIGAGIGLATAGMALLVFATANLAKQGPSGAIAMLTVAASLTAFIGVAALAGKALNSIGVEGAAALMGIALLVASFSLLVVVITQFASTGSAGITALVGISAAIIAMVAAFTIAGIAISASSVGLMAFVVAVLAVSAGVALMAAGLALLINAFIKLQGYSSSIVPTLSAMGKGMALMITNFVKQITTSIPLIASTVANLLTQLVVQISQHITTIATVVMQMFVQILAVIAQNMPVIMQQGLLIIQGFLQGILQGIPMIVTYVGQIIVAFLNALTVQLPAIIQAGVNLIVAFIEGIANGLPRIIQAAVDLIGSFLIGLANAIPRIANKAVEAVEQFVYGVGYALGRVFTSGGTLIKKFIQGIRDGINESRQAGKDNANAVRSGTSGISLHSNGSAIMQSFWSGMKSVWGSIQSWVGGIASWIKEHKGPISYDRKLLIPAGKAIMEGLNNGLITEFANVKANVTTMAERIANAANVTVPEIDANNFSRSLTALNTQMDNSGISVNGRLSANNTFNANSRSFEDQVTTLIAQAVNKLDNVDQHPQIGFNTLDKMNKYFNKQNVDNWWSAKG
ncbi:phage tail tape measure protein [Limosilactobacillus reuteri]|uniref:phage tail tape measure protein n=1 Tax=Limosilactobacillus reuteri TaxID=1598 RepID=UPI002B05F8AA|nr:phage tail tape measure protein [Limosilactobacillus reuteri]